METFVCSLTNEDSEVRHIHSELRMDDRTENRAAKDEAKVQEPPDRFNNVIAAGLGGIAFVAHSACSSCATCAYVGSGLLVLKSRSDHSITMQLRFYLKQYPLCSSK